MLKIPHALRTRAYGGATTAGQARKINFLTSSPGFLLDVADQIGLIGTVEKQPGAKLESGLVQLASDVATIRLHEDPTTKRGIVLECFPASGQSVSPCLLSEVSKDIEVEDWCYRVTKMLDSQPPTEGSGQT